MEEVLNFLNNKASLGHLFSMTISFSSAYLHTSSNLKKQSVYVLRHSVNTKYFHSKVSIIAATFTTYVIFLVTLLIFSNTLLVLKLAIISQDCFKVQMENVLLSPEC